MMISDFHCLIIFNETSSSPDESFDLNESFIVPISCSLVSKKVSFGVWNMWFDSVIGVTVFLFNPLSVWGFVSCCGKQIVG